MVSQGVVMNEAELYIIIPTGCCLDKVKTLLALLKIFRPPLPPIVTALSAAIATACLFNIPTTAVIFYRCFLICSKVQFYINRAKIILVKLRIFSQSECVS